MLHDSGGLLAVVAFCSRPCRRRLAGRRWLAVLALLATRDRLISVTSATADRRLTPSKVVPARIDVAMRHGHASTRYPVGMHLCTISQTFTYRRSAVALLAFWSLGLVFGCASRPRRVAAVAAPTSPSICAASTELPDIYRAHITTSKGPLDIEVHRAWAPLGAERFRSLVCSGFFSQARFYRVVPGFVVQFGMPADPSVYEVWQEKKVKDEHSRMSNTRGTVALTRSAAPNTATTQMFINLADNTFLDESSAPFAIVTSGMEVVQSLYSGYGEHAPMGEGPNQERLWKEGNAYLLAQFPKLDYIIDITLE